MHQASSSATRQPGSSTALALTRYHVGIYPPSQRTSAKSSPASFNLSLGVLRPPASLSDDSANRSTQYDNDNDNDPNNLENSNREG
ncbi:hypothetical protein N7453_001980 [Penicillium expansum]|nr:hypothetical protein N7453_001980 [Penicillium expansum]